MRVPGTCKGDKFHEWNAASSGKVEELLPCNDLLKAKFAEVFYNVPEFDGIDAMIITMLLLCLGEEDALALGKCVTIR